ncbi:hypothetical protein ZWY2020_056590 [Hordeum vulgare]|nr:hypothetical protein ZWY2020_056590 [Hordeum vulgare]
MARGEWSSPPPWLHGSSGASSLRHGWPGDAREGPQPELLGGQASTPPSGDMPPACPRPAWCAAWVIPRGGGWGWGGPPPTRFWWPAALRGSGAGAGSRRLTFELESPGSLDPLGVAPDDPAPEDGGLEDEGGSSEEGSSSEGDVDAGGAPPESPDAGRIPASSVAGPTGHAGGTPVVAAMPLSAADTGCHLPLAAVPEVAFEEEVSVGIEVYPASSPRSPGVVCYSRSPGSPPPPALGSPDQVPPPIVDPGWLEVSPLAPRGRSRESPSPMVAARQSARISQSRVLQDGRIPTIPELAARRAATRDLFPGTSPPPASLSGSLFSVLTKEMVPHLVVVALDSGIVFRGEKGPPLEQISALCAKERFEGALAEARAVTAWGEPSSLVYQTWS